MVDTQKILKRREKRLKKRRLKHVKRSKNVKKRIKKIEKKETKVKKKRREMKREELQKDRDKLLQKSKKWSGRITDAVDETFFKKFTENANRRGNYENPTVYVKFAWKSGGVKSGRSDWYSMKIPLQGEFDFPELTRRVLERFEEAERQHGPRQQFIIERFGWDMMGVKMYDEKLHRM